MDNRACSIARRQNTANVVTTGRRPTAARPPAAAIMFCSAMPNWRKRSGRALRKWCTPVPPAMSASSTTSSGYCGATVTSALPKASRKESPEEPINCGVASTDIEPPREFRMRHAELCQRLLGLLARQLHAAVPVRDVFHAAHALALHRVGEKQRWAACDFVCFLERAQDRVEVVTVGFNDLPAERAELRGQRFEAHDVGIRIVGLKLVVVDDGDEIVDLVMRRAHRGFPHFALLQLAIAQHDVHARRTLLELQSHRHPKRDG